ATITVRKFCGIAAAMALRSSLVGFSQVCRADAYIKLAKRQISTCFAAVHKGASSSLPQLLEDPRVLERGDVLRNLLALGDCARHRPRSCAAWPATGAG